MIFKTFQALNDFLSSFRAIKERTTEEKKCKKRTYPNKKFAQTILNIARKKRRKVRPERIYHCDECQGWHMTSKK